MSDIITCICVYVQTYIYVFGRRKGVDPCGDHKNFCYVVYAYSHQEKNVNLWVYVFTYLFLCISKLLLTKLLSPKRQQFIFLLPRLPRMITSE